MKRSKFFFIHFFFLFIATQLVGCNNVLVPKGDEVTQAGFSPGIVMSLAKSTLTVSNSQVATSTFVTVTLNLKDQKGSPYLSPSSVVTFSSSGGTSVGTFDTVINQGNGIYTASFTGVTPGTPTTIHAQVDGKELSSALPTIQVTTGNFSLSNSIVTVSAGTVLSNSVITVTLTVKDISDTKLPDGGLTVLFSHSGGTSTGTFSATTDNTDGTYTATFTGVTAGTATNIHATIGGATVTSSAPTVTVSAGAAASIAVSINNLQSAVAGSAVTNPLVAVVKDVNNNVKSGVSVTWAVTGGGGAVSSCTNTTDASGLVQCSLTTGAATGPNTVSATVNGTGLTTNFSASAVAGAPVTLAIVSGNAQTGNVGMAMTPFVALVKDSYANVVSGVTVNWSVSAGGGSLSRSSNLTDASGLASSTLTLGPIPATNSVAATVDGSALSVNFHATGDWDADAKSYITRVAATRTIDSTHQQRIHKFIAGLKTLNLWVHLAEGWLLRASVNAGSGTTLYALRSASYNGTLVNGPVWDTTSNETGIIFDGTNDYITMNNPIQSAAITAYYYFAVFQNTPTAGHAIMGSHNIGSFPGPVLFAGGSPYQGIPAAGNQWIFQDAVDAPSGTLMHNLSWGARCTTCNTFNMMSFGGGFDGALVVLDPDTGARRSEAARVTTIYAGNATFRIGARLSNSFYYVGPIASSLVFSSMLTNTEYTNLRTLYKNTIGQGQGLP